MMTMISRSGNYRSVFIYQPRASGCAGSQDV
jgi:hypothetical protein